MTTVVVLAALACSLVAACDKKESPPPAAEPRAQTAAPAAPAASSATPPADNPVQKEMRVLHAATRDWVTAIAQNQLAKIPESIPAIHAAREVTEAALEKGTYKPPKNGDKLADFIREDEAFHESLVALLKASKKNDLPAATRELGSVLQGCTACHVKYRF